MIRVSLLWLVVSCIVAYSWRNWYVGLCAVIAMVGIIEHPDVPKQIFGIPGLNPFNLMLGNVIAAWACQRGREGLRFDMPRHIVILLLMFAGVVVISFIRLSRDPEIPMLYYRASYANIVTDYLINSFKFAIPALLLYDGCRTEERFRLAVISIMAVYVLFALQVAKWMPPTLALDADALERRSLRVLARGMGFHRVNMSAMLSGASWALLTLRVLLPRGIRWPLVFGALFIVYAQLMTGGRAGYAACLAVGLALSLLKWRRYLLGIPVALALVMWLAPGVIGRAFEGFTEESRDTNQVIERARERGELQRTAFDNTVDSYTVTAGRSIAWPIIVDKIMEQPLIGYGRQAMLHTGLATYIYETYAEVFPHPHNAYLEQLLDNGIIGAAPIFTFYILLLWYSMRMFVSETSPTCVAIGGMSTAFLVALFVSAIGSQSFYPEEGWMCAWCVMFLMLRVRVERQRLLASAGAPAAATAASEPVRAPLPALRPAFAGARFSMAARPAPVLPQITWQPRKSGAQAPVPGVQPAAAARQQNGGQAGGSTKASAAPAKPAARFGTVMPFLPKQSIETLGIFGTKVFDRLVWERA